MNRIRILLAALAVLSIPIGAQAREHRFGPFAVLYTEANFNGWSYRVLPGDDIASFERLHDGRWAFLDREIGSIEIRGRMSLELWESSGFRGQSILITESVSDLSRLQNPERPGPRFLNWDNRVESLRADANFGRPSPPAPPPPPPPNHDRPDDHDHGRGPPTGDIIVFADANLRGEPLYFDGEISVGNLRDYVRQHRNWDDAISSIAISGNYEVELFEHPFFQGRSIRLSETTVDFGRILNPDNNYENWHDRISSLTIKRRRGPPDTRPEPRPVGFLYWDSSYRGEQLALYDGTAIANLGDLDWNDKASSLKVEPGYGLLLFADADFRGRSFLIANDQSNLGQARSRDGRTESWNDRASSLKVVKLEK